MPRRAIFSRAPASVAPAFLMGILGVLLVLLAAAFGEGFGRRATVLAAGFCAVGLACFFRPRLTRRSVVAAFLLGAGLVATPCLFLAAVEIVRGSRRDGLYLVATLLVPAVSFAVAWWLLDRSSLAAAGAGLCRNCGYDLTGNTTGTCPECGHPASR